MAKAFFNLSESKMQATMRFIKRADPDDDWPY
jgi:hypothetical protein